MPTSRRRLPHRPALSTLLNLALVAGGAFLALFPACLTVPTGLALMGYGIHRFRHPRTSLGGASGRPSLRASGAAEAEACEERSIR